MKTRIKFFLNHLSILSASFIFASDANAALVHGSITGVIAENAETSGEGSTVFGLDGDALVGQVFVVNFSYDTSRAPLSYEIVTESGARYIYESSDPGLDWLSMSITVNGRTHILDGNFRRADILDQFSDDPFNMNNPNQTDRVQLAIDGGSGPFDGVSFRRQFLDVSVSFPNDVIEGGGMPESFYSDDITRVYNSANFRINEFDFDPATGELLYERYVGLELDARSVTATLVPVPAAAWLFGSGLVGLVGAAARKRSVV